jgi:purine-binding chemotaxis protein CheW
MTASDPLVVFRLDAQRYALPLMDVERIVRAVALTALPQAPAIVLGVIDVAGQVLPVLDLRRRFGLPKKEIDPTSQFLIARTSRRAVVLVVDEAQEVAAWTDADVVVESARIVPGLAHVRGVARLGDGLVLIHDLENFLSLDETQALDEALEHEAPHAP